MRNKIACISFLMLPLLLQSNLGLSQVRHTKIKFRLLIYGYPNFEKEYSENTVGKTWGIEFYRTADCSVTKEFVDSVDQQNEKTEFLIGKKYGNTWRKKFDQEVSTELENRKKVRALVEELGYIKERQAILTKESKSLNIALTPIANSTKYTVLAQGWGKWNGKERVTYYQLLVDFKTKAVKLLSSKIVKG